MEMECGDDVLCVKEADNFLVLQWNCAMGLFELLL